MDTSGGAGVGSPGNVRTARTRFAKLRGLARRRPRKLPRGGNPQTARSIARTAVRKQRDRVRDDPQRLFVEQAAGTQLSLVPTSNSNSRSRNLAIAELKKGDVN